MDNTHRMLSSPTKLYEYKSLETAEGVRLVTILPGQFEDDLQIEIHHALLQLPDAAPTQRLSINQLQETLPDGWQVFETVECKYLFWKHITGETSWDHPNPEVSRMLYAPPPNYPDETFMPKYEALSSVWGDKTQQVEIMVVNTAKAPEEQSKIEVQLDLAGAIRQLRHTDRIRTLWIDVICIDQNDKSEKVAQAKRIGRVYALASAVIVWLGHGGDSAVLGLETLAKFGGEIQHTMDDFCFATPQATYPEWFKVNTVPPFSIDEWIGVVDLLRHAWFHQRWSRQEIQMGNRNRVMMCGGSVKPWETVRKAITALYGRESLPRTVVGLIYECYWLADIKAAFGVDAILGIEQSTEPMKNTSPSWTPDLTKDEDASTLLWQVSTGVSKSEARYLTGRVLEVHGVVCGTVESVFTPDWTPDSSRLPALLQMLNGYNSVAKRLQDCDIELIDELVRIVCDCFTKDRLPVKASVWDQQEVRKLFDAALGHGVSNSPIDINLWARLKARNQGRSLIVSDNGLIGKVGADREMARAGDLITTILGRNSPLLLRPAGNDSYVVVAGAMIPGLCDSISILGSLPNPWKTQLLDQPGHPEPQPHYVNPDTGVTTREDPRLGPLPADWVRVQGTWQASQLGFVDHFRNVVTGEVVHWDPRLDADALRDRGVVIKTFLLK